MRQEKYVIITYEGLIAMIKAAGGMIPKDACIKSVWIDNERDTVNIKVYSSTYDEIQEGSAAVPVEFSCNINSKMVEHSLNLRR